MITVNFEGESFTAAEQEFVLQDDLAAQAKDLEARRAQWVNLYLRAQKKISMLDEVAEFNRGVALQDYTGVEFKTDKSKELRYFKDHYEEENKRVWDLEEARNASDGAKQVMDMHDHLRELLVASLSVQK